MNWITTIKYIVIIAIACAIIFAIHQNGRKVERAVWLQKQAEERAGIQVGINQIVDHVRKENSEQYTNTVNAFQKREGEIEKLNIEYNALLKSHDRLRFKANSTTCDKRVQGKSESTGLPDGEIEIELPRKIESGVRAIINEMQKELIDCNTLKDTIEPDVEIINNIAKG